MNIKNIKVDNKKILILTFGVIAAIAAVLGLSYAYFKTNIDGQNASSMLITSADLNILFSDSSEITLERMMPGQTIEKTFTVQNGSSQVLYYDLIFIDVESTVVGSDFVYTLSSTNNGGSVTTQTIMPTENGVLSAYVSIAGNTSQVYTLSMTYINRDEDQSINQGATFDATIAMQLPYNTDGSVVSYAPSYAYTGNVQTFTAEYTGYYEIELWGAQGGSATYTTAYTGGKGAYTYGKILLNAGETLNVYVGGAGQSVTGTTSFTVTPSTTESGYNGGTFGTAYASNSTGGGGGGATDIRYGGTTLNDRIMVAAGGGGGKSHSSTPSYSGTGGNGGGLIGGTAVQGNTTCYAYGTGGTQNAGGSSTTCSTNGVAYTGVATFGYGKSQYATYTSSGTYAGGGGGYYGGGAGSHAAAGGGSSFISGYAGVNAITSASSTAATNDTFHYSNKSFIDGYMESGVKTGNGSATITYVGASEPTRTNTALNNVRYIKDCINGSSYNTYNHWVELEAIKDGENIALTGTITGPVTASTTNGTGDWYSLIDGDITSTNYVEGTTGNQCVLIDLGSTYNLDEIAVWHYWADGRTYDSNITSVSSDGTTYATIIDSGDIPESSNGKRVNVWNSNSLQVDLNGGITTQSLSAYYSSGTQITLTNPTKTAYDFDGWTVSGTGASINNTTKVLTIGSGVTTLTANWGIPALLYLNGTTLTDNGSYSRTITNTGVTISTSAYKTAPSSLYFSGGKYLTVSGLSSGYSTSFTIETYIYGTSLSSSRIFVSLGSSGSNNSFATGGVFNINPSNVFAYYCSGYRIQGTSTLSTNTWYHIAVVGNGSSISLYLNGVLQGSVSTTYSLDFSNLLIGANKAATSESWYGYIDEFAIYNYAKSVSEFNIIE